jgi:uncharacterized lipoprotein YmbA
MSRTGEAVTIILLFFISACSMPETRIYSISVQHGLKAADSPVDRSIVIQMDSENYLRQPYIVYRNSPYELKIAKYSKWESSPYKIVRKEFKDALVSIDLFSDVHISSVSQKNSCTLRVNLSKFERHDEGDKSYALLEFNIDLLSPVGQKIYSDSVSSQESLDEKDFENLAEVMSLSLKRDIDKTVTAMAEAIRQQMKAAGTDGSHR